MVKFVIGAALLALGACAPDDKPVGPSFTWRCDNGVSFTTRNTEGGNVEVVAGGETYRLPGVSAGSGARYFDGKVEFWEHAGEAMLNGASGGPYEGCKLKDV